MIKDKVREAYFSYIYIKGINLMIENEKDMSVNEGLTDTERERQAEFQLELLAELGLISPVF